MKAAAVWQLVVCVGVYCCVILVAWVESTYFSSAQHTPNTAWRGYALIRVPLHRPPVRIKLGSHAGLVARILHARHLTPSDRDDFAACQEKHKKHSDEWRLGDCVFVDPATRSSGAVALVSLPGSGNTWLRGLLERATGICTGAIYCDVFLREQGFNGEGIKSGAVLVVKTHTWRSGWDNVTMQALPPNTRSSPSYGSAILLVRNPANAAIAEWNRRNAHFNKSVASSHTYTAGPEMFGTNKEWDLFLRKQMIKWAKYFDEWLIKRGLHPVMVIKYEDLQTDPSPRVREILDFLRYPHTPEMLRRQLAQDFTLFQRQNHPTFEHLTADQRALIGNTIRGVAEHLKHSVGTSFGVEEYLI